MFKISEIILEKENLRIRVEEKVNIELELIQGKNYILVKSRETTLHGSQIIINSINIGKKQKIELDNGFKYEIII
ncbi:MAG: hypothetical protein E3J52_03540 [Promethearchaeota archaeon]|nr:MAG: hypothetical protein E3J52_03540 [Candidatus Lokiarchaeota archaeon]